MAFEALDSLARQIDRILDHQRRRFYHSFLRHPSYLRHRKRLPFHNNLQRKKQKILSLLENNVFLSSFLKDFPGEAVDLEARLTNTALQAKDSLKRFGNKTDTDSTESIEKEIDSVLQEAKSITNHCKRLYFSPKLKNIAKETIVGAEGGVIEIKGRLYGEPSSLLEIIPIVGMGGIGKTTLSRYTYQDPSTIHHFDVRVWVTVSQNSSAKIILSSLLTSIIPREKELYQSLPNEELVLRGHKYLKKRRYLIVMDDMWDINVWDDVRRAFPDDCNGSRIIITTRDLDVASYVDSSKKPHMIQLMSVDQSCRLLKEQVFGQENCPSELEKIGRQIAQKCKGLPLAIVVIAGVLSKLEQKQDSWEKITRNVTEALNTSSDEQFSNILNVSYMHLPTHLRHCFLYTACFPEDYEINVSRLIMLWVGEGFLKSSESKDMEELGYEYLEDLASRSLVLIEKKRFDGKIRTVKIHDVLRDLCMRKSRDENFHHIINEFEGFPQGIEKSHRLSIYANISGVIPNMESSLTHTILLFKHWAFDFWKSFRLLRVVHALTITFSSVMSNSFGFIGELIHLRYLALTCEATRKTLRLVSESLYKLQNLQTLVVNVLKKAQRRIFFRREAQGRIFSRCRKLKASIEYSSLDDGDLYQGYMEFEIWRMPQLRQLILMDGFIPDPCTCTDEISSLENLQTLSRIQDFKCSERVLQMIPNIRKLGIIYSNVGTYEKGWSEYGLKNLIHLHKLEKLSLYAESYPILKNEVLSENISFPATLKKLSLSGCRFPWEEMSMMGALPNLEVLKLRKNACVGREWETSEGEFCQLKLLVIEDTDLHEWIADESSFPCLQRLTLYGCHNLREVPNGMGEIPTLELIELDIHNLSVVESVKCIESEQQSVGNDLLQIRFLNSNSCETYEIDELFF